MEQMFFTISSKLSRNSKGIAKCVHHKIVKFCSLEDLRCVSCSFSMYTIALWTSEDTFIDTDAERLFHRTQLIYCKPAQLL